MIIQKLNINNIYYEFNFKFLCYNLYTLRSDKLVFHFYIRLREKKVEFYMTYHKSEDYKKQAVKYYLVEDNVFANTNIEAKNVFFIIFISGVKC